MIAHRTGGRRQEHNEQASAGTLAGSRETKGLNTMRVTAETQKVNTTPATRLKAERLTVLDLTAREAVIEGDNDDYTVIFRGLTCSCPAGQRGLRCSHVQCAVRERARMHGYSHTAFLPTARLALAYRDMQKGLGRKTMLDIDSNRYFIVSFDTTEDASLPPDSAVLAPVRQSREIDFASLSAAANAALFGE